MESWGLWPTGPDLRTCPFDAQLPPPQQHALQELFQRHCVQPPTVHPYLHNRDFRHTVFRRFLGARSWDIERAHRLLSRALVWRTEHKIDTVPFLPCPDGFYRGYRLDVKDPLYDRAPRNDPDMEQFLADLQKVYHGTWHMWDREGNPVFIERTGRSDPQGMVRVARDYAKRHNTTFDQALLTGHLLSMELGCHLTKLQTQKLGRPIFQFTYILDLKDYRLSHLYQPIFTALKLIIENDKRYYPETTCHAFVVNAPGIVTVAWGILSPLLDQRTRDKVQILGGQYGPRLTKAIAPAQLPTFLGGECACDRDCVP